MGKGLKRTKSLIKNTGKKKKKLCLSSHVFALMINSVATTATSILKHYGRK